MDSFFEFLIPSFDFHFLTIRFSFFILMKKLKNGLHEQIKINFMIIITSIVIQEPIRVKFPEFFPCAMVTWTPRMRFLKTRWCILLFTLLAATFKKNILAEAAILGCSAKVIPKVIHKLIYIISKSLEK